MTQHPERRKFVPTPLHPKTPVPADIDIAQAATLKPIRQVAEEMGLDESELELYGDYKAKIKLEVLDRLADAPDGKYIDVTAITPTPPRRFMVTVTKVHLVGISFLIAVPALVCAGTRRWQWLTAALVAAAFAGLGLDFGGWWAMRWALGFAVARVAGHAVFVAAFGALSARAFAVVWARDP